MESKKEPVLQVRNISLSYRNKVALKGIRLELFSGEMVALLGPNGGGKTSLIKSILGLLRPDSGEILFEGRPVQKHNRRLLGYVPQKSTFDADFPILVHELVASSFTSSFRPAFLAPQVDKKNIKDVLQSLKIPHLYNKPVPSLSGGELQKVLIARALLTNARLLLMDEPLSHLDPKSRDGLYQLLQKITKEQNRTILMATHDTSHLRKYFSKIIFINKTLIFAGKPDRMENKLKAYSRQWIF